jgi:hypothetical protein
LESVWGSERRTHDWSSKPADRGYAPAERDPGERREKGGYGMKHARDFLAWVCGTLCVLGLVVGVVYMYSLRVVFNPSMFSNRVADSLAQPAVARVVAGEIVDQVVELHRDLTPYRPILLGTVQYVVSSAPFRAVVRRAAREAHETLISQTGENLSLSVPDIGLIIRNALSMYPDLAAKVPDKVQVAVTVMEQSTIADKLAALLRIGRRVRMGALTVFAGGLVLGACGLLLTRRKHYYLMWCGIGLASVTFLVAGVAYFGGYGAALLARTPTGADLVRGLWPVFVGPLAIRMLILAGIGLVLVAAVTSLLEKIELKTYARAVWGRAAKPNPRAGWGIVRGLSLIVGGIVVAFHPAQSLVVLAAVIGGVLFFIGIQELFTTAVRLTPHVERVLAVVEKKERATVPPGLMVGALVLVIAGAGVFWLVHPRGETVAASTSIDTCNGHPELCDRRLNQVVFAATHNSMSAADIPDWMFPNQERGIRGQLEDGVRGFLIDIHYGAPVGDRVKTLIENEENARKKYEAALGKEGVEAAMRIRERLIGEQEGERDVYLCHGFCELGDTRFVTALKEMREFLVAKPDEIVIIIIQDEGVAPADVAACFAKSGLEDFVYKGSVKPPWPTLREMIENDERVLVFAENNAEGVPWYHPAFEVFQETPYGFKDPSEFSNAPNRGGKGGSLLLMNHWIETTPAPLPSNAKIVNAYDFLLKRARACKRARGMTPNLIAVDFYRTGDLFKVVRTMNGIKESASAPAP